jgi:hypothetical protein
VSRRGAKSNRQGHDRRSLAAFPVYAEASELFGGSLIKQPRGQQIRKGQTAGSDGPTRARAKEIGSGDGMFENRMPKLPGLMPSKNAIGVVCATRDRRL